MSKPAYDLYAKQMYELGHGHALYEPGPIGASNRPRYRIQVGDVGRVYLGQFHRLCNVFHPSTHPINEAGVPPGFMPLPEMHQGIFERADLPQGVMRTRTVRQIGAGVGGNGPLAAAITAGAEVSLSVMNDLGAALIIKRPAKREDSSCELALKRYILDNYKSWVSFARERLAWDITANDLVLIAGCDITAEWATMVVNEQSISASVTFRVGVDPIASGQVGAWGCWVSSFDIPLRCSPQIPSTTEQSDDWRLLSQGVINRPERSSAGIAQTPYNQCIFMRGYRVRERGFLLPDKIEAAALAEPKDNNRTPEPSAQGCLARDGNEMKEIDLYSKFAYQIAKGNPEVDVVLIHDDDVCAHIDELNAEDYTGPCGLNLESGYEEVETFVHGGKTVGQLRRRFFQHQDSDKSSTVFEASDSSANVSTRHATLNWFKSGISHSRRPIDIDEDFEDKILPKQEQGSSERGTPNAASLLKTIFKAERHPYAGSSVTPGHNDLKGKATGNTPYSTHSIVSSPDSQSALVPRWPVHTPPPQLHTQLSLPKRRQIYPQNCAYEYSQAEQQPYSRTPTTLMRNDLEGKVAGMIIGARKSWNNVKGRTELAWPPELEASLVRGLLAYSPTDSRYARELGRFPEQNRFISDYIFKETGQRRSQKQVGWRLQQLKDAQNGKQLLDQVADRTLMIPPDVTIGTGSVGNASSSVALHSAFGFPHSRGYRANHSVDSALPTTFSISDRSEDTNLSLGRLSLLESPHPTTAMVMNVSVKIALASDRATSAIVTVPCPLMRFGGNLAMPWTVVAQPAQGGSQHNSRQRARMVNKEQEDAPSLRSFMPVVVFSSRVPVVAQSRSRIEFDRRAGGGSSLIAEVMEHSTLLVLNRTESAHGMGRRLQIALGAMGESISPVGPSTRGSDGFELEDENAEFIYSTDIVNEYLWTKLCNEADPTRHSIVQELICMQDLPNGRYREDEVFLKIVYHFTTSSVPPPQLAQSSRLVSMRSPAGGGVLPCDRGTPATFHSTEVDSDKRARRSPPKNFRDKPVASDVDTGPQIPVMRKSLQAPSTRRKLDILSSSTTRAPTIASDDVNAPGPSLSKDETRFSRR